MLSEAQMLALAGELRYEITDAVHRRCIVSHLETAAILLAEQRVMRCICDKPSCNKGQITLKAWHLHWGYQPPRALGEDDGASETVKDARRRAMAHRFREIHLRQIARDHFHAHGYDDAYDVHGGEAG